MRKSWMLEKGLKRFGLFNPSNPTIILDVILDEDMDYDELERESTLLPLGPRNRARGVYSTSNPHEREGWARQGLTRH